MMALLFFGILFAIGGSSFALMYKNIESISKMDRPIKTRHPEAPEEGEEVMYVDLSREKLERLYKDE
tara:strand:+ start:197 stop:397 length:201 start_codon:yes stop_codon:yes gene_type:complete